MPYRAMIWTIVTVSLALMAVAMWINAVEPMFAQVQAEQTPATLSAVTVPAVAYHADAVDPPDKKLKGLIKGIVYLSFILICFLLLVGVAASFREWIRYNGVTSKKRKTRYVDAWKIAGERLEVEPKKEDPPEDN